MTKKQLFTLAKSKKSRRLLFAALGVLIVLVPIAFLNLKKPKQAEAVWWNDQWRFRKSIAITYSGSATLADFQVELDEVDVNGLNAQGKVNDDCSDLRFIAQNGEELKYWIEDETAAADTHACTGSDYDIWVKIPEIDGNLTIYMYYGNRGATVSTSSGDDTFDFFDDFSDGTVDTVKWNIEESPSEASGNIVLQPGTTREAIISTTTFASTNPTDNDTAVLLMRADISGLNVNTMRMGFSNTSPTSVAFAIDDSAYFLHDSTAGGNFEIETSNAGSITSSTVGVAENSNMNDFQIVLDSTASTTFTINTTSASITSNNPNTPMYVRLENTNTSRDITADHVFVRKMATTSPSVPAYGSYGSEESSTAPRLYFKLNEGQGTTANNYNPDPQFNGTINESTWQNSSVCMDNNCLYLDGSSDYILVADNGLDFTGSDSFTIQAWVKRGEMTSGTQAIISKYETSGADGGYELYFDGSGDLHLGIDTDNADFPLDSANSSGGIYDDNRWHLITGVKNGSSSLKLYIDGELIDTDSSITSSTLANNDPFYVGSRGTNSNQLEGFIDEIKVYRYVLTDAQIASEYITGAAVLGTSSLDRLNDGLVGYWPMDEATADTCTGGSNDTCDYSGNGNDGAWGDNATSSLGKFGNGVVFDSTSDFVNFTDLPLFDFADEQSFSVSTWFKATDRSDDQEILITKKDLGPGATNRAGFTMYIDSNGDDTLSFEAGDATTLASVSTTSAITYGQWNHAIGIYNANTNKIEIFLNGELINSSESDIGSTSNGVSFRLGSQSSNGNSDEFSGTLDEVRIYNRALSAGEAKAIYAWTPGPVGYWNLDENGGTSAYDISSNNYVASLGTGGSAPTWNIGKFGSSLTFDGTDDYISASDPAKLDITGDGSTTFMAWFKHSTASATNVLLAKYETTGGDGGYKIQMESDGDITCGIDNDNASFPSDSATSTAATYDDNLWHHAVCVKDGDTDYLTLYIDGVLINSDTSITTSTLANDDALYIGIDGNATSSPWLGQIDDVKFYNYARTQEQIVSDMNAGHAVPGSPIGSAVADWSFDRGSGTTEFDTSGNQNDLTLSVSNYSNAGKFGSALQAQGANWASRTDDPDFDFGASESFSLTGWFRNTGVTGVETILQKFESSGADGGWVVRLDNPGTIMFGVDDDNTAFTDSVTSAGTYDNDAWHHFAAVKNGTTNIQLYVDKALVGTTTITETGTLENDDTLYVGDSNGVNDADEYTGLLDEIKIYRFAFSQEQVNVSYNQTSSSVLGTLSTDSTNNPSSSLANSYCPPGVGATCTAAEADWPMNANTGTTNVIDISGNLGTLNMTGLTESSWIPGVTGSALIFSGTNQRLDRTDDADFDFSAANSFTLDGWFKHATASEIDPILTKYQVGGSEAGYLIRMEADGDITCAIDDDDGGSPYDDEVTSTTADYDDNFWHHFLCIKNATTSLSLFLDGIRVAHDTSIAATGTLANNDNFSVAYDGSAYWTGAFDQFRIFREAVSPAKAAWLYNLGGPIGWWKFDECQGASAYDASGKNNHGTITPGAGTHTTAGTCSSGSASEMWDDGTTGVRNYSLDFDGSDDYVDMNDQEEYDFNDQSFTITGWFSRETYTTDDTLVAKKNDQLNSTAGFVVWIDDSSDDLRLVVSDGDSTNLHTVDSTTAFTGSTWYHFAIVYDDTGASSSRIYINGANDSATNTTSGTFTSINDMSNAVDFRTGGESDGGEPFAGELDDIKIYNYPLTAHQVQTDYYQGAARFGPASGAP